MGHLLWVQKPKERVPKNSATKINNILIQYLKKNQISKCWPIDLQPVLVYKVLLRLSPSPCFEELTVLSEEIAPNRVFLKFSMNVLRQQQGVRGRV